jgi:hypothetical protein
MRENIFFLKFEKKNIFLAAARHRIWSKKVLLAERQICNLLLNMFSL